MDISIVNANITGVVADLLVLKYADGFHGADRAVAKVIGFDGPVQPGSATFCLGNGVAAPDVLFIGVGPLFAFRYEQIQEFGSQAIRMACQHSRPVRHLALTVHGPGYGLDAEQAFLSLIAGMASEWRKGESALKQVTVAELSEKRADLLRHVLHQALDRFGLRRSQALQQATEPISAASDAPSNNIVRFGARVEDKPRLFVAMPFADKFIDEYHIGFCESAKANSYVCERLDFESFTGDIVAEIRKRILSSHGVVALLNDHNPNVFLELGFALAHNKPTVLVARKDTKLPFDVSGHRCIWYQSIVDLRERLTREIASLKEQGVLAKSA